VRGTLVGAFETTIKAVKAEYRRLYDKDFPGLGLIERVSIVVDPQLNAVLIHGGPKSSVPVEAID
jgi:hypothetical protein